MLFRRKKKTLPPTKQVEKKASPKTRKAIRFFEGKASAIDLLEESKVDRRKKDHLKIHQPSAHDRFFDLMADLQLGKWLALAAVTAFIVAVAYWGMMQ